MYVYEPEHRLSHNFMRNRVLGFSLMELMITVAVAAILASIAYPSYRRYVMRAQRTDATTALLRVAAAQEKFYLQNNTYTNKLTDAPPAGLGISGSEHGWYTITIPTANTTDFVIRATPVTGSVQADDADCWTFQIIQSGLRTAKNKSGTDNSTACWR